MVLYLCVLGVQGGEGEHEREIATRRNQNLLDPKQKESLSLTHFIPFSWSHDIH